MRVNNLKSKRIIFIRDVEEFGAMGGWLSEMHFALYIYMVLSIVIQIKRSFIWRSSDGRQISFHTTKYGTREGEKEREQSFKRRMPE